MRSREMLCVPGASRVCGIIQRSISRSNTLSVPIQKTANSKPPNTTPAQLCSQTMDFPKLRSMFVPLAHKVQQDGHGRPAGRQSHPQPRHVPDAESPQQQRQINDKA